MTTAELRCRIRNSLLTDSDLQAFCHDHFPSVFERFSDGMERQQKITLLLSLETNECILSALLKYENKNLIFGNTRGTSKESTKFPSLFIFVVLMASIYINVKSLKANYYRELLIKASPSTISSQDEQELTRIPDLGQSHQEISEKHTIPLVMPKHKGNVSSGELTDDELTKPNPHSHM